MKILLQNTSESSVQSLEMEGFGLGKGRLVTDGPVGMPPAAGASFLPGLQSLPPLSIPGVGTLPSMTGGPPSGPVNSIASSIQANLPPERCSSRNSYSPAMSDSGISVDTGSTSSNNSGLISLEALAKLGTISVNAQGKDWDKLLAQAAGKISARLFILLY